MKKYLLSKNWIKLYILKHPAFWYIEDEWEASWEIDYHRLPRQFIKNKYYPEYHICSIFKKTPYTLERAISLFMEKYNTNKLIENRVAILQNKN